MKENEQLTLWEDRLQKSISAYQEELDKMPGREAQYEGNRTVQPCTDKDKRKDGKGLETCNVWNITSENIDAEIDSSIPMPKVSPCRRADERLARMIENMIRNQIDRLPMEKINDQAERTTKKQGACGILVEWDSTIRTHTTTGNVTIKVLHPTRIIPQAGAEDLYTSDYYFIELPMTKTSVKNRWGVDVKNQSEEKPDLRSSGESDEIVTVKIATYKNGEGGIGQFIWVNDVVLSDLSDCQARRLRRCKKCGQTEIDNAFTMDDPTTDGNRPEGKARKPRKDECSYCHSRSWENVTENVRRVPLSDLERRGLRPEVAAQIRANNAKRAEIDPVSGLEVMDETGAAQQIAVEKPEANEEQMQTATEAMSAYDEIEVEIPYYVPNVFPLVMMQNVSALNKWMGESDCDKMADQQNTVNRMWSKIISRMVNAGSKIALPPDARINVDAEDNEVIRVQKTSDLALIKQFDFEGNLQYEFEVLAKAGAEGRDAIGITESFLGKRDATADSAKAKQFAAQQTAGRLESKRVMKKLAFSEVYEIMFKYMIAYADERRPIRCVNLEGDTDYEEFNAYEFLEVDDAGELYWNTDFLFSCDDASGLAQNREAMWQELTRIFQSGGFGNPQEIDTLIMYWSKMEEQHYPGAAGNKKIFEKKLEQQRAMQEQQMQQQMMMQQMQGQQTGAIEQGMR